MPDEGNDNQPDYSTINYDSVVENCLSDEVRATIPESWAKKFKGKPMDDVFKSHLSTEQEISRRVRLPDDETSDEDRRKFFTRCGCPETPDGYEFELPDDHDENVVKWARETFHKAGVSQKKAAAILKEFTSYSADARAQLALDQEKAAAEAKDKAFKKADKALRGKWKGEEYDENLALARKGFEGIFSDKAREKLAKAGLNNDPDLIEAMYEHTSRLEPDHFVKGKSGAGAETTEQMLNRLYPDDAGKKAG